MKKILSLILIILLFPNAAYAFETVSWDKIEVIQKEIPSTPLTDRHWLGGQFVRFVLDKEAVPADYGYTNPTVTHLYDVEVSSDGMVFEKINKKIPYEGHVLFQKGDYFLLQWIWNHPSEKEWMQPSPPKYVYDKDWNLVASVDYGDLDFDFGVLDPEPPDVGDPFYEHDIIKELSGWYYCKDGMVTRDGYTYYPTKFQQDWLKRFSGKTNSILSIERNYTNNDCMVSYDLVYWYRLPFHYDPDCAWQDDKYFCAETENSYYKMKLEPPNNPYVILDGELLAFEEIPVRENDSLLVPMRFLFEQMGAEVDWDQPTKTATAALAGNAVTFSIDSLNATVNEAPQKMDVPARLVNDTTMIPLRFLSENLGYTVTWDQEAQTAFIEE